MAQRRLLTVRWVWVGVLLACASCSELVSSEPQEIGCVDEGKVGAPACDTDSLCARGVCTHCSMHEICGDQLDNDCNGLIDDGCGGTAGSSSAGGGEASTAGTASGVAGRPG
jgi:hypothetical protein